ncbi:MAG TPA: hypothetical protein VKU40_15925, partial [Thermoanaerobaculia bacterium]|nr:hypothetical protein [Thermoanaerobaculia bacterium]
MLRRIAFASLAITASLTLVPSLADSGGKERTFDDQGRVARVVDEFGNATHYRRNPQGLVTSVLHVRNKAGTWEERYFFDREGQRIGESIDSHSAEGRRFTRRLRELGAGRDGSSPPAQRGWSDSAATLSNGFARVEEWRAPAADAGPATPGTVVKRQVTTVAGHSVTVEATAHDDGLKIEDSLGGWQLQRWSAQGLESVEDEHGSVVRVERDDLGRPSSLRLGGSVAIHYHYADDTPQWTEKRIVDLRDGREIWSWSTAIRPGSVGADSQDMKSRPRAAARAFLPGYGLVAEWVAGLYPEGVAVAGLGGLPSVLVSLDDGRAVARSVTLFDPSTARGWDRVDFTADRIFFHLTT